VEDKRFSTEPQQIFQYLNLLFILSLTPSSMYYLGTLCPLLFTHHKQGHNQGEKAWLPQVAKQIF